MPIVAHIVVQGAERAGAFYAEAFGAQEVSRVPVPDGRLMSVQLRIGGGLLHLADEFPEMGVLAPPTIGGTPVVLALEVDDADTWFARAVAACGTCRRPRSSRPPRGCSPPHSAWSRAASRSAGLSATGLPFMLLEVTALAAISPACCGPRPKAARPGTWSRVSVSAIQARPCSM